VQKWRKMKGDVIGLVPGKRVQGGKEGGKGAETIKQQTPSKGCAVSQPPKLTKAETALGAGKRKAHGTAIEMQETEPKYVLRRRGERNRSRPPVGLDTAQIFKT